MASRSEQTVGQEPKRTTDLESWMAATVVALAVDSMALVSFVVGH